MMHAEPPVQFASETSQHQPHFALIDDDNVQLQLYKAQLSKQGARVTVFDNGMDFLSKSGGIPFDAVVIDYYMPELNAINVIERLDDAFRKSCKICVVSGNMLEKADRSSLYEHGIRVFQKNQSVCFKILTHLSSPQLRKCSSCGNWKPVTDFSGAPLPLFLTFLFGPRCLPLQDFDSPCTSRPLDAHPCLTLDLYYHYTPLDGLLDAPLLHGLVEL